MSIHQYIPPFIQQGTANEDYLKNFTEIKSYLSSPSVYPNLTFEEKPTEPIDSLVKSEDVFDELVNNKKFIKEAKETRMKLRKNPSAFTNFTTKYSHLID